MKPTKKRGGRRGSFSKGARGDATHAQALTSLGYPARPRPQAAGLGRLREQEVDRLMRAYGCDEIEAAEKMALAGTFQGAPTDIACPLLEPVAHLESKFYSEPQWTKRAVMQTWREQTHRDAKPHQLPVVIHSWDYCREPLVIVFPRGAHGWHMYALGEWIVTLEQSGYALRDQQGRPVTDPATGRQRRARLRPVAGAATPVKAAALLTVHPTARLDAARWARDAGGDYAAGESTNKATRATWTTWYRSPAGERTWLDFLVSIGDPGQAQLDDLYQVMVGGQRYNLSSLRPMVERIGNGLRLSLIPASNAMALRRHPDDVRDYGWPRGVRVVGDYVYDQDDLLLVQDDAGQPARGPGGELQWQAEPEAQPVALASVLAWLEIN